MRLTAVVLSTSDSNEEIVFSVRRPEANTRYILRAMVGMDGENIIPKFIGFGLVSGKPLYEYTMNPRDVVMRVALNPRFSVNEDVSEIRDEVYRTISATRTGEMTVQFRDGSSVVSQLVGKITKMEVPYFTKEPELQITVECDDPIPRSILPVELGPEDLPDTIPVQLSDDMSTAPHGFSLVVEFTATTPTFTIQDHLSTPDWKFEITPATPFLVNDILQFSSEFGEKQAFWNTAIGPNFDVMDRVTSGSIWPQIFPKTTTLYFPQKANFDWISLYYRSAFWGL